jgi:hypothetical protein
MSDGVWRLAASSVAGVGHVRRGVVCQDSHAWKAIPAAGGGSVLAAVVSDGAGSAQRSEFGSRLAADLLMTELEALFSAGGSVRDVDLDRASSWLAGLRERIEALAASDARSPREYSSTLLTAVVGEEEAVFFQVGDGAMVVSSSAPDDSFDCVFWPASDEYENITFFATEPHATEHLVWTRLERRIDDLALFSDGLQRLALDYATKTAHARFFASMLAPLRPVAGSHEALSADLAAFLDSPRINERTDDDKTLILATRRPPTPAS